MVVAQQRSTKVDDIERLKWNYDHYEEGLKYINRCKDVKKSNEQSPRKRNVVKLHYR